MRKLICVILALLLIPALPVGASAATVTHTVVPGDTLWKLAVKYEVGLSEIKNANPPYQKL